MNANVPARLAAAVLAAAAQMVAAQTAAAEGRLADPVIACSAEADSNLRLACYDREVARLAAALRAKGGSKAHTPASETAVSAEDRFGVSGSPLASKRAGEGGQAQMDEMTATVTALARQPRGELIFTLDNGQVWQQKAPRPYLSVEVGDPVTIRRGALNSFHLVASGRSTRVTRVR